jgi:antirestriction protein ArdC
MSYKKSFNQDKVVTQIVELLEKGVIPWVKPWNNDGVAPHNGVTMHEYKGLNFFLTSFLHPEDTRFFTKNQFLKMGAWVPADQFKKSTPIAYWQVTKKLTGELDPNGDPEERVSWFCRNYEVWNYSQIDWRDQQPAPVAVSTREINVNEDIEAFIASTGAKVLREADQTRAFFRPSEDCVHLPIQSRFNDDTGFYATVFHELIHWSGHADRLNRIKSLRKGDADYAFEELVAELGSAFLCAKFGVDNSGNNQTAAYLQSWLSGLVDHPSLLQRAASAASKAVEYVCKNYDVTVEVEADEIPAE